MTPLTPYERQDADIYQDLENLERSAVPAPTSSSTAWPQPTPEFRAHVRTLYHNYKPWGRTPTEAVREVLELIFGKLNLTSNKQP